MSGSEKDKEMGTDPHKTPSSSSSDDVIQPEAKRVRGAEAANDEYAFADEEDAVARGKTKEPKATKTRGLRKVKPEPVAAPENDENASPEKTEAEASPKKTVGRKRKNPPPNGPQAEATPSRVVKASDTPGVPQRARRSSRKRPSASQSTLPIPTAKEETTALAAGDNEVGQLGQKRDTAERFAPVLGLEEKVVTCAAGGMHSLLLSDRGNVFSFGCNDDGSLGRRTEEEEDCFKPGKILFSDHKIAKIAAGNIHSVALSTDHRVFIWGSYRDNCGAFGISPQNSTFVTEPMELTVPDPVVDVACGADHTLMLTAEGNIYTMGCAEHGRLGRIRKSHCCRENRRARQVMLSPLLVPIMRKRKAVHFDAIWAGRYCTFLRNVADGSIWGCGLNNFHQMGEVDDSEHCDNFVYQPVPLRAFDPNKRWTQICGGEQHTLALDSEGTVYSMGRPLYGRLGLGKVEPNDPDVVTLKPVSSLEKRVVKITAGDHCSFALDRDGQLWSWGQGSNMIAQGDREKASETDVFVPTICTAKALKDKKVLDVSAGSNHTVCVVGW